MKLDAGNTSVRLSFVRFLLVLTVLVGSFASKATMVVHPSEAVTSGLVDEHNHGEADGRCSHCLQCEDASFPQEQQTDLAPGATPLRHALEAISRSVASRPLPKPPRS